MTGITGRLGNIAAEAAKRAAEAARQAAEQAAKAAARAAARAAAEQAAEQQAQKLIAAVADQNAAVDGVAALAEHAGPTGAQAIAERLPHGPGGEFGEFTPPEGPAEPKAERLAPKALLEKAGLKKQDITPEVAQKLVENVIKQGLAETGGLSAQESFDKIKADLAGLAKATGLGPQIQAVTRQAFESVAKEKLMAGVSSSDLAANKALGPLLATLKNSPDAAVQDKLHDTVRGWTTAALNQALEGKEGKDGVEDATHEFTDAVAQLARDTGLGEVLQDTAAESLDSQKDRIEDIADDGGGGFLGAVTGALGDIGDFIGNVAGDVLHAVGDAVSEVTDAVGDGISAVTDVAGDVIAGVADATGDVIAAGSEFVGDAANAVTDTAGSVVGGALDAVGLDGAADAVREGADRLGDVTDAAITGAGRLESQVLHTAGGVVDKTLDVAGTAAGNFVSTTGAIAGGILNVAGTLAELGPHGAIEQAANDLLGPEKFPGQIDGFTGLITNRLGVGDSVFIRGEAGAEVGVGAFAGAKLSGGATLSRNEDGTISLALQVGGGVEAGVHAKTGFEAGGVEATAEAKASVQANANGVLTLKFDPNNPADVGRLKALLEPSPAKLAVAAATANPLALAALQGPALADAVEHNFQSREVALDVGVGASAGVEAEIGPLSAELGIEAEGVAGATQKVNADGSTETTLFLEGGVEAKAEAGANRVSASAELSARGVLAVTVRRDAEGHITGISGEKQGGVSTDAGVDVDDALGARGEFGPERTVTDARTGETRTERNEASGRAHLGDSRRTKVEQELTPQGLEQALALMRQGRPALLAFSEVVDQPGNSRTYHTTTTTDSFTLGGTFGGSLLGVGGEATVEATVGKAHTESDRPSTPDFLDNDMITGGGAPSSMMN